MKRHETGILGEKIACEYLGKRGYDVIETNYRCPEGEIDIIARQRETLVFVEVRTKRNRKFGSPEESITKIKKERLKAAAAHYGQDRENLPDARRIDMVAIDMGKNGRPQRIEIIENAVSEEQGF